MAAASFTDPYLTENRTGELSTAWVLGSVRGGGGWARPVATLTAHHAALPTTPTTATDASHTRKPTMTSVSPRGAARFPGERNLSRAAKSDVSDRRRVLSTALSPSLFEQVERSKSVRTCNPLSIVPRSPARRTHPQTRRCADTTRFLARRCPRYECRSWCRQACRRHVNTEPAL